MTIIPETITPRQMAQEVGWSERRVREKAIKLGACIGRNRNMRLTREDILKIMESERCHSSSTSAARRTTTAGRLPAGGFAELQALRTEAKLKKLQPKNGNVVTMDRNQRS